MQQSNTINGYSKVLLDGVTTLELAKFIEYCIKNPEIKGIKNFRHKEPISKYNLLNLIKEIYGKDIEINNFDEVVKDKTEETDFPNYNLLDYKAMIKQMRKNYFFINPKPTK